MLDKFLDLLWKCKPLFKAFVWIDVLIHTNFTYIPYRIECDKTMDYIFIDEKRYTFNLKNSPRYAQRFIS